MTEYCEYWYYPRPIKFEAITENEATKITKDPLVEFKITEDDGLYFAYCKNPHFAVHAKSLKELEKNIGETYYLIEAELRRTYEVKEE